MKNLAKTVLITVSLLFSAAPGFAADTTAPAKAAASAVKADAKTAAAGKENAKDAKAAVKAAIVDINSATDAELKGIPGIGDAYAAKIIAGRPYANKTQLKSRKILPAPLYEQVKDRLIAKQPPK